MEGYKFRLLNNSARATGLATSDRKMVRAAVQRDMLARSNNEPACHCLPGCQCPLASRVQVGARFWSDVEDPPGWALWEVQKVSDACIDAYLVYWMNE